MDILSLSYVLSSTSCSSSTLTLEVLFLCEVLWYFMAEPEKTRFPFAGVRVLQRSKANRIHICVHVCVYIQVYYKELVQTIMEAEIIRSAVSKLETQGNWCSSCPNLKTWEPETLMVGSQSKNWQVWHPKSWCFGFSPKARKNWYSSSRVVRQDKFSLTHRGVTFFFHSGLQWVGWGSPTWGQANCVPWSTDSNVNLTLNPLTDAHTPTTMFDQMSAAPWSSQADT